jgi:hypothetical protein
MADNVAYTPGAGATIAADEIAGVLYQRVKPVTGVDGVASDVSQQNPMPIAGYGELIEAIEAMRMAIQSLNRTLGLAQVNPLTGRMLVDGSGVTQPISGALTDAQLRASAVPVSGPLTDAQLRATAVPISGNLTNISQLGGQNANSAIISFERNTADNLRNNINVT